MRTPDRGTFLALAATAEPGSHIPLITRLMSDQLTPVLAYRRLVEPDEREAPSFLFESVEGGDQQGRFSYIGAQPDLELIARGNRVIVRDRAANQEQVRTHDDPLAMLAELSRGWTLLRYPSVPDTFIGGWVGFAGYDTARWAEPEKLAHAPRDDRHLPDMHFSLYRSVTVFDHVQKLLHAVQLVELTGSPEADYERGSTELDAFVARLETHKVPLAAGRIDPHLMTTRGPILRSNITREQHADMVARAKEYILAGDIFQVVLGQRFERDSAADPFDVYRALRIVNPSPYMGYLQANGAMLIASSPEILCRVHSGIVTNRPLAGTRRRGKSDEEDLALEHELLADQKERAEHIMLVDLGRNDVGKVAQPASVDLPAVMEIERYSHVMHISSTVTGKLRDGLTCWDALRAALPVGTVSGAPKIRAMQIIDELEPIKRGPYGGGFGVVGLDGDMDIALSLRTIVVPTALRDGDCWAYHLQSAGGIVADSQPDAEYEETVNKAAALARAIDVAESSLGNQTD
ncbi:MAG: anthranilate synthase component I [Phycisphaerales bacterium]|nr:anthranilate synthase component I [Phycisphaerales bacterium]